MNDIHGRQAGFNALSRDQWGNFAGHRREVSALLGAGRGRLCVLGAGNANDLDLPALLATYREVHLVDLDADALDRGAERQGVIDHPGLRRHGGLDLTGMVGVLATWSPRTEIGPEAVGHLASAPERMVAPALPGPFDLVASTCLLSQLIGNAFHAVGEGHPRFPELVRGLRIGHLRLLTGLAARGGSAVLITDVVSSDTVPGLGAMPEWALPALLRGRNFFHGVDPAVLATLHRRDPVLNRRAAAIESVGPWRWNLQDRVYLVIAFRYRVDALDS